MQLQQKITTFKKDHPRVFPFFQAVKDNTLRPGTIIDMKVTTPEGKEIACNIKVTENDIELFNALMDLRNNQE